MSLDEDIITISDDETEETPPTKKVKTEEEIAATSGDSVKINGSGSKLKLTARKRMSSFTPKLNPTPCITLEEDENLTKDKQVHPRFEEIKSETDAYLKEIKGYVNIVEHGKILAKLQKRLKYIEEAPSTTKLDELLEKIKFCKEKVIERPNDVFEQTLKVLNKFENYKGASTAASGKNGQNGKNEDANEQPKEVSNEEAYKAQKRKAHIRKLTTAAKKCAKEIKKLEEEEMSLDDLDQEDSNYIKLDRYKKRYIKLEKEIAKLKEERLYFGLQSDKKFATEASRIPEVNSHIQNLVNKSRRFPDYHDVLSIYKQVSKEKNLQYSSSSLSEMAKDTFHSVGQQLKRRRLMDDSNVLDAYLPEDNDKEHEKESPELAASLDRNNEMAVASFNKVFDEFAEKQIQLKEEPQEVTDDAPDSDKDNEDQDEPQNELDDEILDDGDSQGSDNEPDEDSKSVENSESDDDEESQASTEDGIVID